MMPSTLIIRCMYKLDYESHHASEPPHRLKYNLYYDLLNSPRPFAVLASYVHYLLIAKHRNSLSAEYGGRRRAQEELAVPSQRLSFQEGQDGSCDQAACAAPRVSPESTQTSALRQQVWGRWEHDPLDGTLAKLARLQHFAHHYRAVQRHSWTSTHGLMRRFKCYIIHFKYAREYRCTHFGLPNRFLLFTPSFLYLLTCSDIQVAFGLHCEVVSVSILAHKLICFVNTDSVTSTTCNVFFLDPMIFNVLVQAFSSHPLHVSG